MATTNPPRRTQAGKTEQDQAKPLPGSWEGILQQAREYANNGNSEAVPLFEKVIAGLARLTESRRRAGAGKLQEFYMQAIIGLQSFYATRDRYTEAITVVEQAVPGANEEERSYLEEHLIGLQFMAGHNDAAIQVLRNRAEQPNSVIEDWNPVIWGYIRSDRAHEAIPLLDELANRYTGSSSTDAPPSSDSLQGTANPEDIALVESSDDPAYNLASISGLRAVTLPEAGDIDGGIAAFNAALEHADSPYHHSLHLLYSRLSNAGRYEDALHFIQHDARYPVRAGFWRGLTYRRMGRTEEAKAAWRNLATLDPKDLQRSPVEYTFARFYLGDPDGEALSGVLNALRQNEYPNWTLLMLAGVGFALRGDQNTARNDFRLAVSVAKAMGEGRKLPVGVWQILKDLFAAEDRDLYAQYFELPLPTLPDGKSAAG